MKKIVMLDAYNLIHRARSGFTRGDYAIVYNFFRGLRPLIEMHNPDKVYFVLEGAPVHRTETMSEYKADRVSPGDSFHRQKKIIIDMVANAFPFEVCKADDLECDDLIGNLARHHDALGDDCVVISGDSDFIQLLDDNPSIKIYHPIKKAYVSHPGYHYLTWKSLCGDKTDNIPGIKGVGAKTAEKLCKDETLLAGFLQDEEKLNIFERNKKLIAFVEIDSFTPDKYTLVSGMLNSPLIKERFDQMHFTSILKEKSWNKFVDTFQNITQEK